MDSGVIDAKVMEIRDHDIICRVVKGSGKITTKRHVNLMGEHVSLPTITENDLVDINFGIKLAEKNIGFENNIYTFPYFLTFLLKRFLSEKK